jgi:acetyl-CoA acetyltransferase
VNTKRFDKPNAASGDAEGYQRAATGGRYALCTMCIGVGQGIAMIIERV